MSDHVAIRCSYKPYFVLLWFAGDLSPQNSTVALGKNGTFSCTSMAGIAWIVRSSTISVNIISSIQEYQQIQPGGTNITFFINSTTSTNGNNFTSQLITEGSKDSNQTKVQCAVSQGSSFVSPEPDHPFAILRVFGKV